MKKLFFSALLVTGVAGVVLTARAQTDDYLEGSTMGRGSGACQTTPDSEYYVYYSNGILSDFISQQTGARKIRKLLGNKYNGDSVKVMIASNPSNGYLLDLAETFEQKKEQNPDLGSNIFFRIVNGTLQGIKKDIDNLSKLIRELRPANEVSARILETKSRLSSSASYTDVTVTGHADIYKTALRSGKQVMVVAHSQGNLYANAVYQKLLSDQAGDYDLDSFGIVGVASPASEVAGSDGTIEGYVTSDTDRVINAVRLIDSSTLPGNDLSVPNIVPADPFFGHSFDYVYTNVLLDIPEHVLSVMRNTLDRLVPAPVETDAIAIVSALDWDEPDSNLDLHVYDPYGHVFYSNTSSFAGLLDNVNEAGPPELYYADCYLLPPGTYKFGVNYFSGTEPVTAFFRMSILGVDYPFRSVMLTEPEGESGNDSPSIFYEAEIVQNPDGSFSATVR